MQPWEAALRTRFGKYIHSFAPGLHLRIPVIDSYHTYNVLPRVITLPHQSVRTSDGKTLAVSGGLAYSITDIEKVMLEVDDHDESLINLAMGLLADYISNHTNVECTHDNIQDSVVIALREAASQWGIEVSHLYLVDLCDHRAFRLLHDSNPAKSPTITIT